jgi:anion-transporting  ArsA/GET3 family ATPase
MSTRVLVCCGSGGVGKTTTSAALALALARSGRRVAVLTIDPARRLADSLGLEELGNEPQAVPMERLGPGSGQLDAAMLDMKATWDGLVERYSETPQDRDRILANRYYRFASTRLAGSHEYMAMERLYALVESGRYEVVLLDTPPTRHAIEFLKAPARIAGLFDEGVMHWLSLPRDSRGFRALERGSEMVVKVLKRLIGKGTIGEIAEFFDAMQGLWDTLRERGKAVEALLASEDTSFLLVTTPAPSARAEAREFRRLLLEQGMPLGGFLVNRVVPAPATGQAPPPQAFPPPPEGWHERAWTELCQGVAGAPELQARLATSEQDSLRELAGEGVATWHIPELRDDVHSLEGLAEIASHLQPAVDALTR